MKEDLKNALCGTTIPTVRQGALFPLTIDHIFHSRTEFVGILTNQHIRAHADRLLMFGIVVERATRHAVEGSLFSYVTRIGDYAQGMRW